MTKTKIIKYRFFVQLVLAFIWFLCFLMGTGVAFKYHTYKIYGDTWFENYIVKGWMLQTYRDADNTIPYAINIKAIFVSLYVIVFILILIYIFIQKYKKMSKYNFIYLIAILPFLISCCLCLYADTKDFIGWGETTRVSFIFANAKTTYLPVLGDWLSALIALIMFSFSWLCNHWVKQGVPTPQPKERMPLKRKKSKTERIEELERKIEILEAEKQE